MCPSSLCSFVVSHSTIIQWICISALHSTENYKNFKRWLSSHYFCKVYDFLGWYNFHLPKMAECTHLLLQELQNYNSLLNNHRQENVGSHKKKDTSQPRAKEKPQQDGRRGKIACGIKPHTPQRCWESSNEPCTSDPETPQRLSRSCFWVSPAEVRVISGLPQGQGLWVQQTWVWHKSSTGGGRC